MCWTKNKGKKEANLQKTKDGTPAKGLGTGLKKKKKINWEKRRIKWV